MRTCSQATPFRVPTSARRTAWHPNEWLRRGRMAEFVLAQRLRSERQSPETKRSYPLRSFAVSCGAAACSANRIVPGTRYNVGQPSLDWPRREAHFPEHPATVVGQARPRWSASSASSVSACSGLTREIRSSSISAPWTRSRSESASDRCVHSAAPSTSWSLLRRDSSSASKSTRVATESCSADRELPAYDSAEPRRVHARRARASVIRRRRMELLESQRRAHG